MCCVALLKRCCNTADSLIISSSTACTEHGIINNFLFVSLNTILDYNTVVLSSYTLMLFLIRLLDNKIANLFDKRLNA